MSDILDCNVSMVEDLQKKREPSPLVGVYFIQPTLASVCQIVDDFSSGIQMYPSVHIFFSSKVSNEVLVKVKSCAPLLQVLKTLKESNLEFLTVDSRTMVTDHPTAAPQPCPSFHPASAFPSSFTLYSCVEDCRG
ncbi:uncharacterized protein HaLaN_21383 [Haematococcus lacustris]|uniref:Uncharacterized protein n=1 Tax=Haematococcus lacustris TaxID=44745 RepID=A0A699ZYC3_HAELA|nr:uncharacterized protein HaLaN_21383 [Haematococcus lacustris]